LVAVLFLRQQGVNLRPVFGDEFTLEAIDLPSDAVSGLADNAFAVAVVNFVLMQNLLTLAPGFIGWTHELIQKTFFTPCLPI
jgi:hypothetical protein